MLKFLSAELLPISKLSLAISLFDNVVALQDLFSQFGYIDSLQLCSSTETTNYAWITFDERFAPAPMSSVSLSLCHCIDRLTRPYLNYNKLVIIARLLKAIWHACLKFVSAYGYLQRWISNRSGTRQGPCQPCARWSRKVCQDEPISR